VALIVGTVTTSRTVQLGAGADDVLFPAIVDVLAVAGLGVADLGAVVCGDGPGSFTSLRIAAALAKGIAHGTGTPLFAVPSLLIAAASQSADAPIGTYLVHADALRGERFTLRVARDAAGMVHAEGATARMAMEHVAQHDAEWRVRVDARTTPMHDVARRGAAEDVVRDDRWVVAPDAAMVVRVRGAWRDAPVDLARWEPQYGRLAEAQVKWETTHGTPLPR
jgi:tRNA threonylcarbamoyladenosine biosynthesis protein TsaB